MGVSWRKQKRRGLVLVVHPCMRGSPTFERFFNDDRLPGASDVKTESDIYSSILLFWWKLGGSRMVYIFLIYYIEVIYKLYLF